MGAVLAGRYDGREEPFLIDYSIRLDLIPRISYVDVLRGDPVVLRWLRNKKIIIGGTAVELGDRFNVPNGQVVPGSMLQSLATKSILQGRALRSSSELLRLAGPALAALVMIALWRRFSAAVRLAILVGIAIAGELVAMWLQAQFPIIVDTSLFHLAILAYLIAIALDEIDIRDLLGGIAERHRVRAIPSILSVLQWTSTPVAPTMALPTENEVAHPIDQEFGVRKEFDMGPVGEWPEGLDSSHQLHLRDGGPGTGPVRFPAFGSVDDHDPPAARSRISDGRTVGENAIRLIHEEPPSPRMTRGAFGIWLLTERNGRSNAG